MFNFDVFLNEDSAERNLKWSYIPDHPYRISITGGAGSKKKKTNELSNLINEQGRCKSTSIDKIHLYAKD